MCFVYFLLAEGKKGAIAPASVRGQKNKCSSFRCFWFGAHSRNPHILCAHWRSALTPLRKDYPQGGSIGIWTRAALGTEYPVAALSRMHVNLKWVDIAPPVPWHEAMAIAPDAFTRSTYCCFSSAMGGADKHQNLNEVCKAAILLEESKTSRPNWTWSFWSGIAVEDVHNTDQNLSHAEFVKLSSLARVFGDTNTRNTRFI